MLRSSLDGVKEANNVGVRRVKLMPWSEWLESEEEEVTNDVLVVVMQPGNRRGYLIVSVSMLGGSDLLVNTGHNIADSKLLLCVLK